MRFPYRLLALAAILLCCSAAIAHSTPNAVSVPVIITARHNKLVTVIASDIRVKANHGDATVASLTPLKNTPLTFVLLIDVTGSFQTKLDFERHAASQVFQALDVGSNRGYFGYFDSTVKISRQPFSLTSIKNVMNPLQAHGPTALYDAIVETSEKVLDPSLQPGAARRAIIILTDGNDNASHFSLAKAKMAPQIADVPVFALQMESSTPAGDKGRHTMRQFARTSGGYEISLSSPRDFSKKVLPALLHALDSQYLLTFVPSKVVHDGKLHPLKVKSSQKGLEISAPENYLAK